MKKIVKILIFAVLMIIPAVSAYAGDYTVRMQNLKENFESIEVGSITAADTYKLGGNIYFPESVKNAEIVETSAYQGKAVKVASAGELKLKGEAFTDNYICEFKFMQPAVGNAPFLYTAVNSNNNEQGPKVYLKAGYIYFNNGTNGGVQGPAYNAGEWYTVKVAVNVAEGKYDAYVDGEKYADDYLFSGDVAAYINRPFYTAKPDVETYFDDMRIYKENDGVFNIASEDFTGYLSDKTFTVGASGQSLAGMRLLNKANTHPANISIDAENDSLKVEATESDAAQFMCYVDDEYNTIVAEFDFVQPEKGAIDTLYSLTDRSGSQYGVWIRTDGNDIYTYDYNKKVVLVSNYEANKKYSFKIYANAETEAFDVSVNGEGIANDLTLRTDAAGKSTSGDLKSFGRLFVTNLAAGAKKFYISNINIYTDEYLDDLANIIISDTAVDNIELVQISGSGKNIVWSVNDQPVLAADGTVTQDDYNTTAYLTASLERVGMPASKIFKVIVLGKIGLKVTENDDSVTGQAYASGELSQKADNPRVIIAIYEGNTLKTVEIGTKTGDFWKANVAKSALEAGNYKAKAFVLQDFDSLIPLTKATEEHSFEIVR